MDMKRKKEGAYFRKTSREGYVFISLWLTGMIIFRLFPLLYSLVCSFSDFKLFGGIRKWGIMNYSEILFQPKIITSFITTFRYALITVPLKIIAAMSAALLLNKAVKGMDFFRTVFYIPTLLGSSVGISVLWKTLFRDDGVINSLLNFIRLTPVKWLSDENSALWVISLLRVWQFGSAMVIFLAALKSVPPELYEAAKIDGAGKIKRFFSITVPFMSPAVLYNIVTQTGLALQEFNAPFIITQGGPRNSTVLISMLIYNTAFQQKEMGMACALTWVFLIVVSVISTLIFISQKYWVYYNDNSQEEK